VIVAPDPAVRQALTQLIRADLQAQGGIAEESHLAPVLVEQEFSNKKLFANYRKGDEIYYKTGSPTAEGIPNNSAAMVISVNCNKDTTTVETQEGEQISYDPPQLRRQPVESIIYREETRELAEGGRFTFTTLPTARTASGPATSPPSSESERTTLFRPGSTVGE
jgi:hypothetical protein